MISRLHNRSFFFALIALLTFGMVGCKSLSNTEKGAVVGAGAGAVVGGAIGKATGSTAKGAIIGAAVGGTAGAIIGRQMDKQAEELEQELENAQVERVGEGIQITFDSAILFDFNKTDLRPNARQNLQDLAQSMNKYPNTEAVIIGHTDDVGSEEYNQRLSERRAESVASYLRSLGVTGGRLRTEGRGELSPVASNGTAEGRQRNRRVEIAIVASDEYREQLERQHN